MMDTAQSACASASWRFEAILAAIGLCHPPAFYGGAWSAFDTNTFRVCAIRLAAVAGHGFKIDGLQSEQMETALQDVRWRLLLRDLRCWPELPCRRADRRPVDFSILVGWGAGWWFRSLDGRGADRPARRAQVAAARVVFEVDRAVFDAVRGGPPAHLDLPLTRRIDSLGAALTDLHPPRSAVRPIPADVAILSSMQGGATLPIAGSRLGL